MIKPKSEELKLRCRLEKTLELKDFENYGTCQSSLEVQLDLIPPFKNSVYPKILTRNRRKPRQLMII